MEFIVQLIERTELYDGQQRSSCKVGRQAPLSIQVFELYFKYETDNTLKSNMVSMSEVFQ